MSKEQAVRDAALKLHDAIREAEGEGLSVAFPRQIDELPAIAISETAAVATTVQVQVGADVPDEVAQRAQTAAGRAAAKEVDKAAAKG